MTDTDQTPSADPPPAEPPIVETADTAAVDAHSPPAPRRWPWLLALLILGGAAILTLYALNGLQRADQEQRSTVVNLAAAQERIRQIDEDLDQLRQQLQRLSQRLDGANASNKVLREEILGLGEREALLEETVARIAQSRIGGESALRLNEAEFLLSMGAARLELYGDAGTTIRAFALAEGVLAGLDDPALSTLRQTLSEELGQLRAMSADPRPAIRAELLGLGRDLPHLPPRPGADGIATGADGSRLLGLLSRLVTVRRYDPQASLLGPSQRQAALASVALQLELARMALDQSDEVAFGEVLARIGPAVEALVDPDADSVRAWLARLGTLREARLRPELPALGATLRELRNQRALRQARSSLPLQPASSSISKPASPASSSASSSRSQPAPDAGKPSAEPVEQEPVERESDSGART